jgi:hypothetical protein
MATSDASLVSATTPRRPPDPVLIQHRSDGSVTDNKRRG